MAKVTNEEQEVKKEEYEKMDRALEEMDKAEAAAKVKPKPKQKGTPAFISCKQSVLMEAVSMMDGLLGEVILKIDENGLTAISMDAANVAMYMLDLKPEVFNEIGGKVKVGVQVKALKGMLKRAKADDNVRITFKNPIELVFASKFNKTFTLPQIDIQDNKQKLPILKHNAIFKIKTELLCEAIEDSGQVADTLTFEVKDNKLSISAKGDMSGYEGEITELKDVPNCKSKFAREYMAKVIKKVATDVTVKMSTDYPILFEYDLGNESKMTLLVAPRIETE